MDSVDTPSDKENSNGATTNSKEVHDVIIVGAGAAGIGVAISVAHSGVENFLIVDRKGVGSSFAAWPAETRFITPSFPSNSIGMLDLNSVAIGVSPAFNMRIEHPTGKEYAEHLQGLADFFELPIRENTNILGLEKTDELFHLETDEGTLFAKKVIWAAGEYQYPSQGAFLGSDLCLHTSRINSYSNLDGEDYLIIGGYESGIDAAYHLSKHGKSVRVFDQNCPWGEESSDPSVALSTYTFERIQSIEFETNVELFSEKSVQSITYDGSMYELKTEDGGVFQSGNQPLLANGFEGSHKLISNLFEHRDDGFAELNDQDESTITPGLFLAGPMVRHDGHIFCFIFKYRQRFAIVAQAIAESFDLPTDEFVAAYKSWGMYLDDLSCCGQECLTC